MRRREFLQQLGGSTVLRELARTEVRCDLLQVEYGKALLERSEPQFLDDLRRELENAEVVTIWNEGLIRDEAWKPLHDLFAQLEGKGKRFERRS